MFERWLAALSAPHDAALLAAAVADDVRVDRHAPATSTAPGEPLAPIAETFATAVELAAWFRRTPAVCTFALVGEPAPHPETADDAWAIDYSITAGEFFNTGLWIARPTADDRVATLAHRPHALSPDHGR